MCPGYVFVEKHGLWSACSRIRTLRIKCRKSSSLVQRRGSRKGVVQGDHRCALRARRVSVPHKCFLDGYEHDVNACRKVERRDSLLLCNGLLRQKCDSTRPLSEGVTLLKVGAL